MTFQMIFKIILVFILLYLTCSISNKNIDDDELDRFRETINKHMNVFIDEINYVSNHIGPVETTDLLSKVDELKNLELQSGIERLKSIADKKNFKSMDYTPEERLKKIENLKTEHEIVRQKDIKSKIKILELRNHIKSILNTHITGTIKQDL